MTIYLPLALEVYNKTFSGANQQQKAKAQHNIYKWRDQIIVSPQKKLTEATTPESLIHLKKELEDNKLLIVDRVHSREPIIQIIDHRNQTGINPLTGKTPIDKLPRFPDVSKLYDRTERGLPKEVVNCVGPGRFGKKKGSKQIRSGCSYFFVCRLCRLENMCYWLEPRARFHRKRTL
ncbi:MAG: hypothetical protein CMG31_00535 [Candidatus Marinimicrobia bacterium]|nr:hypothetical protein [Candidatus Neomarinimicrobiota bacterium]